MRTRFAPSPTGYLHIGGVRTALFNWLLAKKHGGQFILRIDDTDQQRNVEQALAPILAGFRWLGIDWDEGPEVGGPHEPYYQSRRGAKYRAAVETLLQRGAAYRDYSTPQEVQEERDAAQRDGRSFVYSRRYMAENDAQAAAFESAGREAVIRLKMPREGTCVVRDQIRGDCSFDWAREQDHVIQRADGTYIYHLASVVDDHDFEISHVVRAEEHLSNTPRQIFIAESLGYEPPRFAHLPVVAEPGSKTKLSKRKIDKYLKNPEFRKVYDHGQSIAAQIGLTTTAETFNPVIVDFYREVGYLPEAVINYLLLLGWSLDDRTEDFSREQMIESFSLERVNKGPASFDPQKLIAFQERHMGRLPLKQKPAMCLPYLQQAKLVETPPPCAVGPQLLDIIRGAGDRIKVAGDILDYADFFLPDERLPYDEKAFEKRIKRPPEAAELLRAFRGVLASLEPFDAAHVEAGLKSFVEERGIQIGQIIHSLRVAVTGKAVGFGLFETLAILGRDRAAARIDRALSKAGSREGFV